MTADQLTALRVFPVHADFRVVALAQPPAAKTPWLTPELLSLFSWHAMHAQSPAAVRAILQRKFPALAPPSLARILAVADSIRRRATSATSNASSSGSGLSSTSTSAATAITSNTTSTSLTLSLRHLVRICAHVQRYGDAALADSLARAVLLPLLPAALRHGPGAWGRPGERSWDAEGPVVMEAERTMGEYVKQSYPIIDADKNFSSQVSEILSSLFKEHFEDIISPPYLRTF